MPRTFVKISIEELKQKIETELSENEWVQHHLIKEKLGKDLKVKFDFENFEYKEDKKRFGEDGLIGYRTLSNGLTFCGMFAGGDWEIPVSFIVYWDGKKLRAYIPTDGNPWNTTTKEAYGNDEEDDLKNAKKRWPDEYEDEEDDNCFEVDAETDWKLIEADIIERIKEK